MGEFIAHALEHLVEFLANVLGNVPDLLAWPWYGKKAKTKDKK